MGGPSGPWVERADQGAIYSADGMHVATASYDHTAKVWEAATGKELVTLSGHGATVEIGRASCRERV